MNERRLALPPSKHTCAPTGSCPTATALPAYTRTPSVRLSGPRRLRSVSPCAPGLSRLPADGQHRMPTEGRDFRLPPASRASPMFCLSFLSSSRCLARLRRPFGLGAEMSMPPTSAGRILSRSGFSYSPSPSTSSKSQSSGSKTSTSPSSTSW